MPTVSQAQFGKIVGKSPATISTWVKEGLPVIPPKKRGQATKVDTTTAIEWLMQREFERGRPKREDPRRALYEEQRRKYWLENEAAERQLVKLGDVQVALNEVMVAIASELEGLPGRMAGELAGLTDPALVRQSLRVQTTNIRQAAADRLARLAAIAPSGGDHASAAAKKPRPVGKRKKGTAPRKRRARAVSK